MSTFTRIASKTRGSISAFIVFLFLVIASCTSHTQPLAQKVPSAADAATQNVSTAIDPATIALDSEIPTDPKVTRIWKDMIHMIRSIQETDKNIEETLTQKKDLFSSEIKQIRKGQRAIRGYGGNLAPSPRFISRQG